MIENAPVIGAHFLGDADIQYFQDVGPGQTRVDLATPLDPDYPALLAMVHTQQFAARREYPARPSDHHMWDAAAGAWTDPRSSAEIAAQAAAALAAARRATSLDKSELLIRLVVAGVLTPTEAEDAAAGAIPDRMAELMSSLPPDAQMAARIKWRTDSQISRSHPVIVAAAYGLGITDEVLDEIFGVMP